MGICLTLWRSRIGNFNQKQVKIPKHLRNMNNSMTKQPKCKFGLLKLLVIFISLSCSISISQEHASHSNVLPPKPGSNYKYQDVFIAPSVSITWPCTTSSNNSTIHAINGNRRRVGYRLSFWNCRKKLLNHDTIETNKLTDIKCFIQKHRPHVLGIIESDLHSPQSDNNRNKKFSTKEVQEKLKIEGYSIVFPETWNRFGQARIIAFVSDEIVFKQKEIDSKYNMLSFQTLLLI